MATTVFCMGLLFVADIEKEEEIESRVSEAGSQKNVTILAGLDAELFGNSFTTESGEEETDEKTKIERKEVTLVASAADIYDTAEPVQVAVNDSFGTVSGKAMLAGMLNQALENQTFKAAGQQDIVIAAEEEADKEEAAEQEVEIEETEQLESVETVKVINNRWDITLTEEEINLLAGIVWLEANGEPVEGQQAVVEVVFNRMKSELYPDTLYEVLSQKNPVQFCSWKNIGIAKPTEKEYNSIRQVLSGNSHILRSDTLYFSTSPLTSHTDVRIGGHSFCY